jgi:carbamoyl-phosphate synthase small subunit
MRGAISSLDLDSESLVARVRQSPPMLGRNLAQEASRREISARSHPLSPPLGHRPVGANAPAGGRKGGDGQFHVVIVDAGTKEGIVRDLMLRKAAITVVPYDTEIEAVLSLQPDSVLVSNGPGDPAPLHETIQLMRGLLERRVPLAGICLGHQLLGLALGGQTYKMRFGHRGANHPVKNLSTGRIFITTQNHGFAVDPTSLSIPWEPLERRKNPVSATMADLLPSRPLVGTSPLGFGPVEATHLSLNDGTLEGLRLHDLPALSVQYHPEASPGPHDARAFFGEFIAMMEGER